MTVCTAKDSTTGGTKANWTTAGFTAIHDRLHYDYTTMCHNRLNNI